MFGSFDISLYQQRQHLTDRSLKTLRLFRENLAAPDHRKTFIVALNDKFGGGDLAAVSMASADGEPIEEYEYEGLPPNFSTLQMMTAGAFAGIAVRNYLNLFASIY